MGNIISSFLSSESIGSALSFVAGEAENIWGLQGNLDALQTEFDKLIQAKDDLLNEVNLAEQQPRTRRTYQVKGWLQRVQLMGTKVTTLQATRAQEIDRLCLGGFCSKDLISSYRFGRRVVELKKEVIDLKNERGDIVDIYEMVPEDPAVELPVERTVVGQESILDQVWRCITEKENNVGIIGLYGRGGVGKTTLLKQVNNHFRCRQHNFDVVIWVVVSRELKLQQIQHDIGERIGLLSDKEWQSKSVKQKALDISNNLSQKKFVLLLDDIWQPIDLTEVGVPLQSLNVESKIVFTTRSLDVCGQMRADKGIEVSTLTHGQAWKLFQEEVGTSVLGSHPDIPKLAETLAKECRGLPLALKTIGRAMASRRNREQWQHAINVLRTSASKFPGMEENVFSRLKFSYDCLPRDELRSCLLYCCLFPEDFRIPKRELINYWISEGFSDGFGDGYTIVGDLVSACLLEEEDDNYLKMHDVIRDMALWIACKIRKKEENFLVRAGVGITKAPKIEEWEGVKRVSLTDNKIESLSEIPNCPHLQTLFLDRNCIMEITDGFFELMRSLRVLSLSQNSLTELPSGISSLVSLQHLDVSYTDIRGLPHELKALLNLRYLNLERTYHLSRFPPELISSFSKLEVLRMLESGADSTAEQGSVLSEDAEPLMKELLCLKLLNLISFSLYSSRGVRNFLKFPKLLRITQALSISDCEIPLLNVSHLAYMEHLKDLFIDNSNLEELKTDCTGEVQKVLQCGFRSLHLASITFCSRVKDLTWLAFAPNLKIIVIMHCDDLEEIISVEKLNELSDIMGELNFFAKLELLDLYHAESLKSIYQGAVPLPQLKEIRVTQCPKLKTLPLNSSSTKQRYIVISGGKDWWEELQWEDQATQNAFSTCFVPSR
ncbi:hypothetical protein WN944_001030 [Citrus x changshan-huyou]|uniref:AAA+ ATPase domain-containing protein n=1 Tax=Citrus x changshan-huyou TaxID=2935761 RepID=A0AAP0MFQ6_9ROSI